MPTSFSRAVNIPTFRIVLSLTYLDAGLLTCHDQLPWLASPPFHTILTMFDLQIIHYDVKLQNGFLKELLQLL
jgi:hypothetical protein